MRRRVVIWYAARLPRERALLGAAALIALALLVWIAVLAPFGTAMTSARLQYEAAATGLGKARAQAAARQVAPSAAPRTSLGIPIAALLEQAAAEAGFAAARVTPAGPSRAAIAIDAARAEAAFAWVRGIEARGGRVTALRATANPDRTIRLEATFEAGVR